MVIDANKCADGCSACVDACNEEHNLTGFDRPETDAAWIRTVKLKDKQTGHIARMPVMCQHCEHPPCVDVCPTNASFKRVDGIVLVDRHRCIGCRYCMMACPYKARSFVHEALSEQSLSAPRGKGCVESCTLCVHRIDEGVMQTACQEACAKEGHAAILFGDLMDPNSEISQALKKLNSTQIRADLELNTGVRYFNL
jgi:molybdopterin-containing oxidoreductase family iron-sulfur binding subunit